MSPAFQDLFICMGIFILFIALYLWLNIESKDEKHKIAIITAVFGIILLLVGSIQ